MPSKSKSMRRTMGWALACKKGTTDNCPPNIQKIADAISADKLEDFAKTKHKGLPEIKKKKKKANESYVLSFEEFLLTESVQTMSNLDKANAIWYEFTVTNKKITDDYLHKFSNEIYSEEVDMTDGERSDNWNNFVFLLYYESTLKWDDKELVKLGNYKRTLKFTDDELHFKDSFGKDIFDYIEEFVDTFLEEHKLFSDDTYDEIERRNNMGRLQGQGNA